METLCALFQKLSSSEKVYVKEGGVVSRASVDSFLSHNAETVRRDESLSVSLISCNGKVCIQERGRVS